MKFSIIIPLYNQVEYVADAIDSCLSQTVKPHEIIVIDDGSTDGGGEFVDKYVKDGVKVIHQVNKGLPSARNTGIMNATGDYIWPLDGDDMLLENAIEVATAHLEKDPVDLLAVSFKCFGVNNDAVILLDPDQITADRLINGQNMISVFSPFKREFALKVGGYSPRMVWGYEDLHFWINLLTRGATLGVVKEPIALYRVKENSMITNAQKHHDDLMAQIRQDFV